MAVVVGLATVIGKETHRVTTNNVLGKLLDVVLGAIPESGNGFDIFVERKGETVLLVVVGHELESVVLDVAEQLDAGLNTPVPLVLEHQGVAEEETGLVATHVSVGDGVSVDDLSGSHVGADLCSLVLVNPLGERPVLLGDLAISCLAGSKSGGDLLELVVERLVVEEDPVVAETVVEAVLDLANGTSNFPDVRVASESNKGGVHARAGVFGRRKTSLGVGRGALIRSCGSRVLVVADCLP